MNKKYYLALGLLAAVLLTGCNSTPEETEKRHNVEKKVVKVVVKQAVRHSPAAIVRVVK